MFFDEKSFLTFISEGAESDYSSNEDSSEECEHEVSSGESGDETERNRGKHSGKKIKTSTTEPIDGNGDRGLKLQDKNNEENEKYISDNVTVHETNYQKAEDMARRKQRKPRTGRRKSSGGTSLKKKGRKPNIKQKKKGSKKKQQKSRPRFNPYWSKTLF